MFDEECYFFQRVTYKRCDITTPKTESDSEDDEPGVTKQQLDVKVVQTLLGLFQ